MYVNFDDLRLIWPPGLVLSVLRRRSGTSRESLHLLLEEAFVDSRGLDPVRDGNLPGIVSTRPTGEVGGLLGAAATAADSALVYGYVTALQGALENGVIRPYTPTPYFRRRSGLRAPQEVQRLRGEGLIKELLGVLIELDTNGYFDDVFGSSCADESWEDRAATALEIFTRDLGQDTPWMWPIGLGDVDRLALPKEDALGHVYDLIELCHDLAARPRTRHFHDFHKEWDYFDFDRLEGRMVYRWRVNSVLERSDVELRLSKSGPDEGRLVRTPSDPRAELPAQAVATAPSQTERDRLQHAITQFRDRSATRHHKRDALRTLAGLLEHRRDEAKDRLGSQDAKDLFHIINKFDIRHQDKMQSGDYDDTFLDWIFWTLLASLDLMNSVPGRATGSEPG